VFGFNYVYVYQLLIYLSRDAYKTEVSLYMYIWNIKALTPFMQMLIRPSITDIEIMKQVLNK